MPIISLTVTAGQAQRIATAFGRYWNLGRDATLDEVRDFLIRQLKGVIAQQERAAAEAQITITDVGAIT